MRHIILTILFFSFMSNSCQAQSKNHSLKTHQWQNRLLLVIAKDSADLNFQQQIYHLSQNQKDLIERKLVVYKVLPNQLCMGLENMEMVSSHDLYKKYNPQSTAFKVVLIGLDGRVKLKQTELLYIDNLNGVIDAMPMRMNELRNKKSY